MCRPRGRNKQIVQIQTKEVQHHVIESLRHPIEVTLNAILNAEADRLCQAKRYQREQTRLGTRAGYYEKRLKTTAGEVILKVPRLRSLPFETAVIERYKSQEVSVAESLREMLQTGISARAMENIVAALNDDGLAQEAIDQLSQTICDEIGSRWQKNLNERYPSVYLEAVPVPANPQTGTEGGLFLVAIGISESAQREVLAVMAGDRESKQDWLKLLSDLHSRGLTETELFVSDRSSGLVEALAELYPQASWQRCVVQPYRDAYTLVPKGRVQKLTVRRTTGTKHRAYRSKAS